MWQLTGIELKMLNSELRARNAFDAVSILACGSHCHKVLLRSRVCRTQNTDGDTSAVSEIGKNTVSIKREVREVI